MNDPRTERKATERSQAVLATFHALRRDYGLASPYHGMATWHSDYWAKRLDCQTKNRTPLDDKLSAA
jgi:hypothetical protein